MTPAYTHLLTLARQRRRRSVVATCPHCGRRHAGMQRWCSTTCQELARGKQ